MNIKKCFILLTIICLFLFTCENGKGPTGFEYPDLNPADRGELLEYIEVKTITKSEIQNLIRKASDSFSSGNGQEEINMFAILGMLRNGVTIYKVFYSSKFDDKPVVLSGLVLVPDADDTTVSHFQYHHGSLMPYEGKDVGGLMDAPSLFDGKAPQGKKEQVETMLFCLIPASNGYFVSAPDYPGYGISEHMEHPYCYPPALAKTSADMLLAAKDLSKEIKVTLNARTFLSGVSEGGLVSMVTHRHINNELPNINITASANYAGPYNLSRFFQEFITGKDDLSSLNLYNWALYSYWKRNKNLFPEKIWTYEVNNQEDAIDVPSNKPADIYTQKFINSAHSDTGKLITEVNKMDTYTNWDYSGKIYLHHGNSDQTVPVYNTTDTYEFLKTQGASVEKYLYKGNHYTAIFDFFNNMNSDFQHLDGKQYYASQHKYLFGNKRTQSRINY